MYRWSDHLPAWLSHSIVCADHVVGLAATRHHQASLVVTPSLRVWSCHCDVQNCKTSIRTEMCMDLITCGVPCCASAQHEAAKESWQGTGASY